ncbi:hypothetical protein H4S04_007549, partial [Coemansia sp. S16]
IWSRMLYLPWAPMPLSALTYSEDKKRLLLAIGSALWQQVGPDRLRQLLMAKVALANYTSPSCLPVYLRCRHIVCDDLLRQDFL